MALAIGDWQQLKPLHSTIYFQRSSTEPAVQHRE